MSEFLEIINLNIIIHSIIQALLQNILVDIFKVGDETHFHNVSIQVAKTQPRIINKLLLIISGLVMFAVLYFTEILNLQETVITCILSTIIAWIFYKVKIYTQLMDIVVAIKNAIINFVNKKIGG